jgi:hypothetical protein
MERRAMSSRVYDKRFADTVFFIEATGFEQQILWEQNDKRPAGERLSWGEDCRGFIHVIGYVDSRPVNVSFSFATLNGARVCFYEAVSQVVDFEMVDKFLREELGMKAHCNAQNFHLCENRIVAPPPPAPAPFRELLEAAKNGAERLRRERRDIVADERHLRNVMREVADTLAAAVEKCEERS